MSAYLCEFCNELLDNKEDFTHHFTTIHTTHTSYQKEEQSLFQILQEKFSEFTISIKPHTVILTHEDCIIHQYILPSTEQMLERIEWKITKRKSLLTAIRSLGSFKQLLCHHSYKDETEESDYFLFDYTLQDGESFRRIYEPYSKEETEEQFINSFCAHFVQSIEGVPYIRYIDGIYGSYYINGIPIESFLRRAKRAKIEFL